MNMQKEINWLLKEKYKNKPLEGRTLQYFNEDIQRLKAGEPVDYVIGFVEFLSCKINLSKKPLIPRPETEFWMEEAIKGLAGQNLRILDIFAGSGCIGVAVLKNLKNTNVVFAEKDKKFVEQIKINVKINQPSHKASAWQSKIIQSDVFSNVKGKFDYIFANPPYISTIKKHRIQKSVLKYEPSMALFGGKEGLFYIKKFLSQAPKFLNSTGQIFMEFDYIQKRQIEALLKKYGYKQWEFKKDQYKKWRWVIIEN